MDAGTQTVVREIMADLGEWVKALADDAAKIHSPDDAVALEARLRGEGLATLGRIWQRLFQDAVDRQPAPRICPDCGGRRRHRGRRTRGVLSSVGAVQVQGVYWHCRACQTGQHSVQTLESGLTSRPMRELLCLLGTSLTSFAKASKASKKLLGAPVSDELVRTVCRREGFAADRAAPAAVAVAPGERLVGSCDGTMVHTREDGWRELKGYRFDHAGGQHGRAYLESSLAFAPRLRAAARRMGAGRAGELLFVGDAAAWIEKAVSVQLPTAHQIVDYWHACEHIHEAARGIYGDQTPEAGRWGRRYCEELHRYGGRVVWNSLRRVRYKSSSRQSALSALLGYLNRHADRMDYPTYVRAGWPIGSGRMESYCKQLGGRLKGPGMRWRSGNVDAMATLVSLWAHEEWDAYWESAA